ncbi:MAG: glycosyltransferase, partial [Planctomycetota bacterium]
HNGIPEGLVEGKTGFLVPEKDVEQLAEKIAVLVENAQLREEMGRAGREYVSEKYEIKKLVSELYNLYQSI